MDEQLVRSGDAVFRCTPDLTIAEWNDEAERLTGIPAAEAVGRPCWAVLRGRDDDGGMVCHPGCSIARLAAEGRAVRCADIVVQSRPLAMSTIVVRGSGEPLILHLLREREVASAPEAAQLPPRPPELTPRQLEILGLLAAGVRVREIARRLWLSETTVRNHVRAVLVELGAHSQLEAVARARQLALVA